MVVWIKSEIPYLQNEKSPTQNFGYENGIKSVPPYAAYNGYPNCVIPCVSNLIAAYTYTSC